MIGDADITTFFDIYNEALNTEDRFNKIEIHFNKTGEPAPIYTWDQDYYDRDVAGNKKLRRK